MARLNKKQQRLKGLRKVWKLSAVYRAMFGRDDEYYKHGGEFEKKHLHVRKPCSCYMCVNERKRIGEVTRQEKLVVLEEKEQLRELEDET